MEVMVWGVMRCCRIGCVAFYALLFINFLTLNLMYSSISRSLFGNTAVASLLVLCSLFMAACDKEYSPDVDGGNPSVPSYASISIRVADVDGQSFDADAQTDVRQGGPTRVLRPLGELCGRISYALYTEASDGTGFDKVVESEQKSDDESFGQMTLTAPKGKYRLVVIAHSGLKKATLTNPEKITFDGKVTDTFYSCTSLELGTETTADVQLKRAVAMFRFVISDKVPSAVKKMRFYYTGGSSTFDALSGCGIVNSKQTEARTVSAGAYDGESSYDVYTFPRANSDEIDVTVSALGEDDAVLYQRKYSGVPVRINCMSRYTGTFFTEPVVPGDCRFTVWADDQWDNVMDFKYDAGTSE